MNVPEASAALCPDRPVTVLWVTTKRPWPPHDGGRLLVAETLRALDPQQVRLVLAGPWKRKDELERSMLAEFPAVVQILNAGSKRSRWPRPGLVAGALGLGKPLAARKHSHPAIAALLHRFLATHPVDVIHAEQPHALGLLPKTDHPLLLRAQNVECDLWSGMASMAAWPRGAWLRSQAAAVKRWEVSSATKADRLAAMSEDDLLRFQQLGLAPDHLFCLAPPISSPLDAGSTLLEGNPSLLLFAGSSWRPNRLGEKPFLRSSWPLIRRDHPSAHLHLFSSRPLRDPGPQATCHSFPDESRQALPLGSILLVPAAVTSGVRMKILEAWARGLAVITSSAGARGLSPDARAAIAIADQPHEWSTRLFELSTANASSRQAEAGRRILRQNHNPDLIALRLLRLYRELSTNRPLC